MSGRGRTSIDIDKVTPRTVLKSDAHENSTFPLAMALGSAMPHTACQSDFVPFSQPRPISLLPVPDLLVKIYLFIAQVHLVVGVS